jgi:flagellin
LASIFKEEQITMPIQNNIMAVNTHRPLGINQLNQSKAVEKLSSGCPINRTAINVSSLSAIEKIRAQNQMLCQTSATVTENLNSAESRIQNVDTSNGMSFFKQRWQP